MAIRNVTRAGVGLAIGIIILAVLVFAGLWFVRERGEQARREEAIAIADQQLQAESNQEVATKPDEGSNRPDESTSEEAKPGTTSGTTATNNSSSGTAQTATELPQTGANDGAIIVVAGVVTFAALSLYRSRQMLLKVR